MNTRTVHIAALCALILLFVAPALYWMGWLD